MRLTDAFIQKTTVTVRTEFKDDLCRGLTLRMTPTGKKVWELVLWSSAQRKTVRRALGEFPAMMTGAARRVADESRSALATEPAPSARPQAPEPETPALTFEALAIDYVERYAKLRKKSWGQDVIYLKRPIAAWGDRAAASLKVHEVADLLDDIALTAPVSANRTKSVLNTMFSWALGRGLIPAHPLLGWREKPGGKEKPKDRVLSPIELRTIWGLWSDSMSHQAGRLVLLTAQRPGEVCAMRLEDVNFRKGTWTIRETKNGKAHTIPLGKLALAYLLSIVGERRTGPVFPSPRGGGLTLARNTMSQLISVSGVGRFTAHDLRRTAASGMREEGASTGDIGAYLNHTEQGVTAKVYALTDRNPEKVRAKEALDKWLAKIGLSIEVGRG